MIKRLLNFLKPEATAPIADPKPPVFARPDPLDPIQPLTTFNAPAFDQVLSTLPQPAIGQNTKTTVVGDSAGVVHASVGDGLAGSPALGGMAGLGFGGVPEQLQNWYASQTFIGHQACALLAQHWLVAKACSMAGIDAMRNGYEVDIEGKDGDVSDIINKILKSDKHFRLHEQCIELATFTNVFGIRVVMFLVESDDPEYYSKPFNPDGVTKGSYKGMKQIDPYWLSPILSTESSSDPTSPRFYEPDYWVIGGRRIHYSHLVVTKGEPVADILKPVYYYGGVPLTQRIYERVYAAERTANEAPLLAMSKRTTTLHLDATRMAANQAAMEARLAMWTRYRDNHAVKILGTDETMEQFDINLSDFDSVIMNQYQLVAAIAKTPATKLLGTSPKGFNATGEFEMDSYHEELESIQARWFTPLVNRHHLLTCLSAGLNVETNVVWKPVDTLAAEQLANLNKLKADTGIALITAGVISPDEERQRIRVDDHSGYTTIDDATAETEFGMTPENIAELAKAQGEEDKGEAAKEVAASDTKFYTKKLHKRKKGR